MTTELLKLSVTGNGALAIGQLSWQAALVLRILRARSLASLLWSYKLGAMSPRASRLLAPHQLAR